MTPQARLAQLERDKESWKRLSRMWAARAREAEAKLRTIYDVVRVAEIDDESDN